MAGAKDFKMVICVDLKLVTLNGLAQLNSKNSLIYFSADQADNFLTFAFDLPIFWLIGGLPKPLK